MPAPSFVPLDAHAREPLLLNDARSVSVRRSPDGATTLATDTEGGVDDQADMDARLVERRGDRWWIVRDIPGITLNGRAVTDAILLFDRDVVDVGQGQRYEFVSGEKRTAPMQTVQQMIVPPRKRRQKGLEDPARPLPWMAFTYVGIALLLLGGAIGVFWYGAYRTGPEPGTLTDREAFAFDSLLVVAYDHIERGNTLLELGLQEGASQEFARGINALALSTLRNHPQVKPRISALERSVAAIYRAQQLDVPNAYAGARGAAEGEQFRVASLSQAQFKSAFGLVASAYLARFGIRLVIVGADHAEHVSLYGKGGALDLRSSTMTPQQLDFVITQCRTHRIRVKDFSQDSILRRQIQSAIRAGYRERAGTGLHLHIDRFANRRDRWTTDVLR